ncbi:MAG: hypothetical protein KKD44_23560 [Proteobacteria bacterium]|nr:hypothetical protein [Pseudomonadota bacterium]
MVRNYKRIVFLEWFTSAGLILFWLGFFTIGLAPEKPPEGYFVYEHSFPMPDILLAIALIYSGVLIKNGNPLGKSFSLACAGAVLFLGILDVNFNVQNGMYTLSTLDFIMNAFNNLWCVFAGIYLFILLKE